MEYYSTLKKKEILSFLMTWMELEGIMLSEISQMRKEHMLYDSIYMKCPEKTNL